jgi:hypothetical protein
MLLTYERLKHEKSIEELFPDKKNLIIKRREYESKGLFFCDKRLRLKEPEKAFQCLLCNQVYASSSKTLISKHFEKCPNMMLYPPIPLLYKPNYPDVSQFLTNHENNCCHVNLVGRVFSNICDFCNLAL